MAALGWLMLVMTVEVLVAIAVAAVSMAELVHLLGTRAKMLRAGIAETPHRY